MLTHFKTYNEEKQLFYLLLASSDTDVTAYIKLTSMFFIIEALKMSCAGCCS